MKEGKHLLIPEKSFPDSVKNKFYSKVLIPSSEEGCMEYIGQRRKGKENYGYFNARPSLIYMTAHRFSYILYYGEIPENMCILHKCDNPPCVRPDHLILGTHVDNIIDRNNKGRTAKGINKVASKLNNEKVIEIRKLIESGERLIDIAKKFNVNSSIIANIKVGRIWKHVK
jgi:hypothetical protein